MSLLAWIIIGAVAGVVMWRLRRSGPWGCARDVTFGVLGATIGGELYTMLWPVDASTLSIPSLVWATVAAVLVLTSCHLSMRRAP